MVASGGDRLPAQGQQSPRALPQRNATSCTCHPLRRNCPHLVIVAPLSQGPSPDGERAPSSQTSVSETRVRTPALTITESHENTLSLNLYICRMGMKTPPSLTRLLCSSNKRLSERDLLHLILPLLSSLCSLTPSLDSAQHFPRCASPSGHLGGGAKGAFLRFALRSPVHMSRPLTSPFTCSPVMDSTTGGRSLAPARSHMQLWESPLEMLITLLDASIIFGNCHGKEHLWRWLRTYFQSQSSTSFPTHTPCPSRSLDPCPKPLSFSWILRTQEQLSVTTICITLLFVWFCLIKRQKGTELPLTFSGQELVWSVTQAEEIRRQFPGDCCAIPKS